MLHEEADYVTTGTAPKTMKYLFSLIDGKGWKIL
jgi:hypothetical protein